MFSSLRWRPQTVQSAAAAPPAPHPAHYGGLAAAQRWVRAIIYFLALADTLLVVGVVFESKTQQSFGFRLGGGKIIIYFLELGPFKYDS